MKRTLLKISSLLLMVLSTFCYSDVIAQISLLRDINNGASTQGSFPSDLIVLGGYVYYSAYDGVTGTELWRSDGTALGTTQVRDINPGDGSGSPSQLTLIGSYIYFRANDGENGTELWRTDGTKNGTVMVADISPGINSSSPGSIRVINSTTLYFTANDGTNGGELWKTDVNTLATTMIADINPTGNSSPSYVILVSGTTVYFSADDGTTGRELWKSDGSGVGTVRVKDINPTGSSSPEYLTVLGSTVYFSASDGTNGAELWGSNGTSAGTTMVSNINATGNSYPYYITAFGSYVYFSANDGTGVSGEELWRSNGTTTQIVSDIESGPTSSYPTDLVVAGSYLYFIGYTAASGYELFKTTGSGSTQININATAFAGSSPYDLTNIGSTLYFSADDGSSGYELWKYNGTSAAEVDILPGAGASNPSNYTLMGSTVFFAADNGSGTELWRISTSGSSATQVVDLIVGTGGSSPSSFVYNGSGITYFVANDGNSGTELWKTDGTLAGTIRVKDINVGTGSSSPANLIMVGSTLYFSANDGTDTELYRSDGTSAGTVKFDINTGVGASSSPSQLFALNSTTLLFRANDGTNGIELWSCVNGNSPVLVENINATVAGASSNPFGFKIFGTFAYYSATDGVNGTELWRISTTTPSAANNSLFSNINTAASTSSSPQNFFATSGLLFFSANSGTGAELWKTDGTSVTLVEDINTTNGTASSSPFPVGVIGSTLFFTANDGTRGIELWKSDGTAAGTDIIKDINTLGNSVVSSPLYFSVFNSKLYFQAFDLVNNGTEIWVSDGTAAGTQLLKDINPGAPSGGFSYPVVSGSSLYFIASDGTGPAIFVTDGVRGCATFSVPPYSGVQTSTAINLTSIGTKMIFSMIAQGYDREPFLLDPSLVTIPTNSAINTQPVAQSKILGSSVTFTVGASGTNLTYQWQKNSVDIPSATSTSYTIASVVGSDAAQYRCLVNGTCGNLISNNVTLTVTAAEPTTQPTSIQFTNITVSGFTVSFTAATDNPTGYLAVRKLNGSPSGVPQDGIIYTAGNPIGDGVVAFVNTGTTFNESLAPDAYSYDIFSYNELNGSINYKTDSPLEGTLAADNTAPQISNETTTSVTSPTTTDLKIVATITENESSVAPGAVKVQYRSISSGAALSSGQDMLLNSGKWEFTIPAIENGDLGIEYKITATNTRALSSTLTAKATLTYSELPITFTVFGATQDKYRIISVPLDLNSKSLSDLLVDDLGSYDKKLWRMYRYENSQSNTVEMSTSSSIETGKGYWLIVKEDKLLDASLGKTVSVSESEPFKIPLTTGWNLIGNPYPFNVAWSDVQSASSVTYSLRTYDGVYNAFDTKLDKFEGAFVFATGPGDLIFPVKRNLDAGRISVPTRARNRNPLTDFNWEVIFSLRNGNMVNEFGGIGMNENASEQQDQFDDFTLPRFMDYLELNHQKRFAKVAYTKDIVPTSQNREWDFIVETNLTSNTALEWDNSYFGEGETSIVLWDVAEQRAIDMKASDRYMMQGASRSFKVFYGNNDYVKERTTVNNLLIHSVVPNPTQGQTQIAFTLPGEAESKVQIRILNILGQSVSTVYSGMLASRYHEVVWDGKDFSGEKPAQGVYLVEVWQGSLREVKRLVVN